MADDGPEAAEPDDQAMRALQELDRAADRADSHVREQVLSVEEGLREIVGGDKTSDAAPHADRLEELEEKLAGLARETDGEVNRHVTTAEALIAGYERNVTEE